MPDVSDTITYSVEAGIGTVTINRPEKLNAFNSGMLLCIRQVLDLAEQDDAVRVVVLIGAGRSFSSGQDLTAVLPNDDSGRPNLARTLEQDYSPLILRLSRYPKITLAALNGPAVGAAANIALACDIVVAARSSYLQQAFVRIALVPDVGGTWLLPRILGPKLALALALTGDRVMAEEAKAMGLVYRVFDDADFSTGVRDFAASFVAGPAMAYRLIKQAFGRSPENDLETQLMLEAELQGEAGRTDDFLEAIKAFAEKRPPVFGLRRSK